MTLVWADTQGIPESTTLLCTLLKGWPDYTEQCRKFLPCLGNKHTIKFYVLPKAVWDVWMPASKFYMMNTFALTNVEGLKFPT